MLDCIGVGVGPANLSVASLLREKVGYSAAFFEKKPTFSWHEGMDIDGATIQVNPVKDLVTLADPTNRFSFLSYLHETGRIYHFLNAGFESVTRREFSAYMAWAARKNDLIHFGVEVSDVQIAKAGGFTIETSRGAIQARNVTIGVGTVPNLPDFAARSLGQAHYHVCGFAKRTTDMTGKRVAIVGGGQSGAEAVLNLITRADAPAEVRWISRRQNFSPIDDSPFANELFMPCYSDFFFRQDQQFRSVFVRDNVLASDGISGRTLSEIYQRLYILKFIEKRPPEINLLPGHEAVDLQSGTTGSTLLIRSLSSREVVEFNVDVVIWATGFHPMAPSFLDSLKSRLDWEGEEIRVDENFEAKLEGQSGGRLFVMNAARRQRGLADPNLSLMAWRSQRIINTMLESGIDGVTQEPAFMLQSSWAASAVAKSQQ